LRVWVVRPLRLRSMCLLSLGAGNGAVVIA
jgi:hypothetical protein